MHDLLPYLKHYRRHLGWVALGGLLGLLTLLAGVGLIALSGWFLSATAFAGLTVVSAKAFNFFHPGAMVRLLAILRTAGRYGERLTTHEATFRLLAELRVHTWQRLLPLAPSQLLRERGGELLGRLTSDIDALDNLYLRLLQPLGLALVGGMILSLALTWLDPQLALIAGGGYLLTAIASALVSLRGNRAGAAQTHAIAALRGRLLAGWEGFDELQVYGAWQRHTAALHAEQQQLLDAQGRECRLAGAATALIGAGAAITSLGALWHALGLWQSGTLDGPFLALVGLGTLAAFEALGPLVNAFAAYGRSHAAAQRLNALCDQPPTVSFPSQGARPMDSRLLLEKVQLRHGDSAPLFAPFDLDLVPGERVALAGPSGSGKSSLLAALVRDLDPSGGRITLGGLRLNQLDEATLRSHIALLTQQEPLFAASLRDNLLLTRPNLPDEQLLKLLDALGLGAWLANLPDGLDTWLGHQGERLSGGQARRIALGRLLLSPAPILLLDEPTEGLDRRTRNQLWAAIEPWLAGRSLIVASHQADDWAACTRTLRLAPAHTASIPT